EQLLPQLMLLPKALAIGALATIVYTAVPLGFSALVPNRRYAIGLWAAYYLIGGTIADAIGFVSASWIAAIDLPTAIATITNKLLDFHMPGRQLNVSVTAALVSIGV